VFSPFLSELIPVSFDSCAFPASVALGLKIGLPRDYNVDYGVVLSECILWILLFPTFTESLLDDGMILSRFLTQISSLGVILTFVTLDDKFATPAWRYIP
jgi:hypothetical protein